MGGGISVVAVETRVQMDPSGRCMVVETAHPLHFGPGLGGGGPDNSFRFNESRLHGGPSNADPLGGLGSPPLLLGSFGRQGHRDNRDRGGGE